MTVSINRQYDLMYLQGYNCGLWYVCMYVCMYMYIYIYIYNIYVYICIYIYIKWQLILSPCTIPTAIFVSCSISVNETFTRKCNYLILKQRTSVFFRFQLNRYHYLKHFVNGSVKLLFNFTMVEN